jgi:hypothetical protein
MRNTASEPHGVNAHLAAADMLARFAEVGIGWLRIDVDWDKVEPAPGARRWDEVDRVVADAEGLGLEVLASLAYAPPWATRDGLRTGSPSDPARWRAFVAEALARYAGRVRAVSLANEPNLRQFFTGTKAEYLRDVLVPGLEAAREVAPRLLRCGPDLSSSPAGGDVLKRWLGPILDAAGGLLDVVTHHQYDGRDTVTGRVAAIDKLHAFLRKRGDGRPLWITEIGWKAEGGVTPELQAVHLRGVMRAMRERPWWQKTFWYDSHGAGWGLLEPDGSPRRGAPRPALAAYAAAIEETPAPPPVLSAQAARVLVEHAYRGILGREPDAEGVATSAEDLLRGGSLAGLCRQLVRSDEFRSSRAGRPVEALVDDLYHGILERVADEAGAEATAAAIRAGQLDRRASEMLASAEFRARFLPPDE